VDTYLEMMAQPPWDTHYMQRAEHPFYILHYTYGMDYTLQVGTRGRQAGRSLEYQCSMNEQLAVFWVPPRRLPD
jgi:hypothetical protein